MTRVVGSSLQANTTYPGQVTRDRNSHRTSISNSRNSCLIVPRVRVRVPVGAGAPVLGRELFMLTTVVINRFLPEIDVTAVCA